MTSSCGQFLKNSDTIDLKVNFGGLSKDLNVILYCATILALGNIHKFTERYSLGSFRWTTRKSDKKCGSYGPKCFTLLYIVVFPVSHIFHKSDRAKENQNEISGKSAKKWIFGSLLDAILNNSKATLWDFSPRFILHQ